VAATSLRPTEVTFKLGWVLNVCSLRSPDCCRYISIVCFKTLG